MILTPGLRARQHNDLAGEFIGLERDLVRAGDEIADQLAEPTARRLKIEAAEPPILRVLDATCHDELLTFLGGDEGQRARISRLQRWLANWADFRADRLRKHSCQAAGPAKRVVYHSDSRSRCAVERHLRYAAPAAQDAWDPTPFRPLRGGGFSECKFPC